MVSNVNTSWVGQISVIVKGFEDRNKTALAVLCFSR